MSYKSLIALAIAASVAVPANAAMTVGTFLSKAAPLRANPLLAFTSPDYAVLKAEADAATRQLKEEGAARLAAGKRPIACIPDSQSIGIMDMLSGLDALSPADRKLPLKDGYARVIARKFPC